MSVYYDDELMITGPNRDSIVVRKYDYFGTKDPIEYRLLNCRYESMYICREDLRKLYNVPTQLKASSSYCPDYSQIPHNALVVLAKRFELGEKKHGRDNWRKSLDDPSYLLERLNHVIHHAKKLQEKLQSHIPWDKDDDIGGMLWGCAFACEALHVQGIYQNKDKIDPEAEV